MASGDLLTPSRVRRLLDEHGLAPRKAAGQNFVVDPNTVRRIVDAAGIAATDTVLEIGPGLGSLTLGLAAVAHRVVAVEIDAGMVRALQETVGGLPNVEVVHADALEVAPAELVGHEPARVVANLPYNVATPLMMRCLTDDVVGDLFVMVQREVGERWCAPPGHPLRAGVSVKVELLAHAEVVLKIPRTVFHPVPNVDSVMVALRRRPGEALARGAARFAFVDAAFRQRRKTLRNNLRHLLPAAELERLATAAGVDLGLRAEAVPTARLVALADALDDAAR